MPAKNVVSPRETWCCDGEFARAARRNHDSAPGAGLAYCILRDDAPALTGGVTGRGTPGVRSRTLGDSGITSNVIE